MTAFRIAVLLFALLLPSLTRAEDKKTEVPTVTFAELFKDPKGYDGKLVRIEGVLEKDPGESVYMDKTRYNLRFNSDDDLSITSFIKPGVKKGNRVRVTGTFHYKENSFVRYRLFIEAADGTIEKLTPEKKDDPVKVSLEDLVADRKKYHGKMVQVEVIAVDPVATEKDRKPYYSMDLGREDTVHIWAAGKADFKAGDRLRITGQFDFKAPSFARLRINTDVVDGKIEKLAPEKKDKP